MKEKGMGAFTLKRMLATIVICLMLISFPVGGILETIRAYTPPGGWPDGQPYFTVHLVLDTVDSEGQHAIALSIQEELAKIGIEVILDYRGSRVIDNTVWNEYWNITWDDEPNLGWDMTFYRFPRPKSWAVIVCGSKGGSFRNNTGYMYHVLSQHYNFDDIYYLSRDIYSSDPGVIASSTKANVRWAIRDWLGSRSNHNDLIFIYFSSHGGGYDVINNRLEGGREEVGGDEGDEVRESTLGCDVNGDGDYNDWVGTDECMEVKPIVTGYKKYWDDELSADLSNLQYAKLIFVRQGCVEGNQSCFGGGLIDDISAPNRIIMTATNETWYSYGDLDGAGVPGDGYSEWSERFIDALHGERTHWNNGVVHETPPVLVDADFDDDGRVSMLEAWNYAWNNDEARNNNAWNTDETPWLDDNGNGFPTYINEHDVLDSTDGQLASETYLPPKDLEENLKSHYLANATPPNGGYNIMGWNNGKADEFLVGGIESTSPEVAKAYFDAWQAEWMRDPPAVIIYYPQQPQCARGIAFNLHHPVLSNRYVRQAIAHAIPYQHIFEDILQNYGIQAEPGKTPIHHSSEYFNTELDPYTYRYGRSKAQQYLDMWRYAQTGTDYTKGPIGDADFDGIVDLDDLWYWLEHWGDRLEDIKRPPGNDLDPDFNNNGVVGIEDFPLHAANYGKEYPLYGASEFGSSSSSSSELPAEPADTSGGSISYESASAEPYVKVYVDQPLGYIPGQPPHRTVTVDVIIEVTNITDNSAEGIVGWAMDIEVNPDVLNISRAKGATTSYFLYEFAGWYWYDYPTLLQGNRNATTGYWDELAEIIMPLPNGGAGNGTSYPTSSNLLVTLEFTSKSKPKYSLIDLINVQYLTPDGTWHPANEIIDGHYNPPPT